MSVTKPQIQLVDAFLVDHKTLFDHLVQSVEWDCSMAARRTASFGVPYNYSQMSYAAVDIPESLRRVASKLKSELGMDFNNCLLNYYETGDNRMGFHSDDTTHLQPGTGVAIVSLGCARNITFRSTTDQELSHDFILNPGSLLYMDARVQAAWQHAIKKQKNVGPRISLTWRAFNVTA